VSLQVNPERQWQKIIAAGLCPEIKDFATYEAKTAEQLALAYKAVLEQPILSPGPVDAAAVHGIIFEGVHPWAGMFRTMGQTVRFDQGVVGLDAHRIVPELTRLQEETTEALQKSASPQQQAMAIACFHARFRRTHPFLDGNTRTSAVLLEGQMHAVFNLQPRIPQRPDDYKLILAQAYRGEIAPLTNHILSATGHALVEPVQVAMPAPMFDQDLETEIIKHRDAIIAEQRQGTRKQSGKSPRL
jgi:hypothetical protein